MERYFTFEDYAYGDRTPTRKRFEVVDGVTNKVVGTFTGGDNPEARAELYAEQRNLPRG